MIRQELLFRSIHKERRYWQGHIPQTQFTLGIIKGLEIALDLLSKLPVRSYHEIAGWRLPHDKRKGRVDKWGRPASGKID